MRIKLQGGTVGSGNGYTYVLMRAGWTTHPQWFWDGRTAAATFPNAFPWVEGPL